MNSFQEFPKPKTVEERMVEKISSIHRELDSYFEGELLANQITVKNDDEFSGLVVNVLNKDVDASLVADELGGLLYKHAFPEFDTHVELQENGEIQISLSKRIEAIPTSPIVEARKILEEIASSQNMQLRQLRNFETEFQYQIVSNEGMWLIEHEMEIVVNAAIGRILEEKIPVEMSIERIPYNKDMEVDAVVIKLLDKQSLDDVPSE